MNVVEFFFRLGGVIVGLSVAVGGISIMIASRPLAYICGRNCAIAGFLSIFGEPMGRILYGSMLLGFGIYILFIIMRPKRNIANPSESNDVE